MLKRVIAVLLVIFALALPAFAHSGRTDSKGGHYNRSTGEYHYHHGYSAHKHTGGVCPYSSSAKTPEKTQASTQKSPVAAVIESTSSPEVTIPFSKDAETEDAETEEVLSPLARFMQIPIKMGHILLFLFCANAVRVVVRHRAKARQRREYAELKEASDNIAKELEASKAKLLEKSQECDLLASKLTALEKDNDYLNSKYARLTAQQSTNYKEFALPVRSTVKPTRIESFKTSVSRWLDASEYSTVHLPRTQQIALDRFIGKTDFSHLVLDVFVKEKKTKEEEAADRNEYLQYLDYMRGHGDSRMFNSYPRIKCKVLPSGVKCYYLPFDEKYSSISMYRNNGDVYVSTVSEAKLLGFSPVINLRSGKVLD